MVFDDATAASCLGATEVVEELVIRRDGRHCEQIYPHFVFRAGYVWTPIYAFRYWRGIFHRLHRYSQDRLGNHSSAGKDVTS